MGGAVAQTHGLRSRAELEDEPVPNLWLRGMASRAITTPPKPERRVTAEACGSTPIESAAILYVACLA